MSKKRVRYTFGQSDLTPWESHVRMFREKGHKRIPFDLEMETSVESLPELNTIVKRFRDLRRLGPNAHMWMFHEVTGGRLRSDKNKRVWISKIRAHDAHPCQLMDVLQRTAHIGNWEILDGDLGFEVIREITDRCNRLRSMLVLMLNERKQTTAVKQRLLNLREMPEFVEFQSHRRFEHKSVQYEFAPRPQGGNKDPEPPAKPLKTRMYSVHGLMQQYHTWLTSLKHITNTKQTKRAGLGTKPRGAYGSLWLR